MLYAILKSIHLLSFVVWVGGMFFTLVCLRPALAVLEGPSRLRLMTEVLRRFLAVVGHAVGLMVLSGGGMLFMAYRAATAQGGHFTVPHAWYAMITLGLVMAAVYGHLRARLLPQLERAVQAQDGPAGAAVLGRVRALVIGNLAIAVVVVLVMRVGIAM
jgi:uncharacterized membrane protein